MMMRWTALLVSLVLLVPVAGTAETLITHSSLVSKTPGADFHLGTMDDGNVSTTIGPNLSGANVRGAASYLLLKANGSIPADGNDFDYIIFFDGTLDLSLDMAASGPTSALMNIIGGSLRTTPEFTPGRTGGMVTSLSGTVTFNVSNSSAAADFSGHFDDPAFITSIMHQTLTAAPGSAVVVMRSSFGSSGNAYVDSVLTPLVPAGAGEIALIEFTGTANGVVSCCSTFGVRGVFALYGTEGSSTSTTLPGGGSCSSVAACGAALQGTLPKSDASDAKVRKTATKLGKLATAAEGKLTQGAGASGSKRKRLFKSARSKLSKLLAQARAADKKGHLGVPLQPIVDAVNALLAQIPAS